MCAEAHSKKRDYTNLFLGIATLCGLCCGLLNQPFLYSIADGVSNLFVSLLKLVSLPIIFLSIVFTASSMESISEIKKLGGKVIKYTLLTTVIAATIALILFVLIDPVKSSIHSFSADAQFNQQSYFSYLLKAIPSNFLAPFVQNNVIGVLFLAMLFSFSVLALPSDNRSTLNKFFSSIYAAVMVVTRWIVKIMPIGIWAFITLCVRDLRGGLEITSIVLYLACVVTANLVQGIIVLPTFLKLKGLSPTQLFKQMLPALSVAFFTKSSGGHFLWRSSVLRKMQKFHAK